MKDFLFYVIGFSIVAIIFIIFFTAIEYQLGMKSVIIDGLTIIIAINLMNSIREHNE